VQPGHKTFYKNQTLHYMVGYKQEAGQEPILCADEPASATNGGGGGSQDTIAAARPAAPSGATATSTASKLPQWIENDRKARADSTPTVSLCVSLQTP
jgi:hypothetical protein